MCVFWVLLYLAKLKRYQQEAEHLGGAGMRHNADSLIKNTR